MCAIYSHFTLHFTLSEAQRPQASTSACSAAGLRSAIRYRLKTTGGRGSCQGHGVAKVAAYRSLLRRVTRVTLQHPLHWNPLIGLAFNFHQLSPTFHHLERQVFRWRPESPQAGLRTKKWLAMPGFLAMFRSVPPRPMVGARPLGARDCNLSICPSITIYIIVVYIYISYLVI